MSSECVVPPLRLNSVRCVRGDVISPSDTAACEGQGVPQHQAACLRVLRTGCRNTRANRGQGRVSSNSLPWFPGGMVLASLCAEPWSGDWSWTWDVSAMATPEFGLGYPWRWLHPWKPDTVAVQEFIRPHLAVGATWLGLISLDSVSFKRVHGHTLHWLDSVTLQMWPQLYCRRFCLSGKWFVLASCHV